MKINAMVDNGDIAGNQTFLTIVIGVCVGVGAAFIIHTVLGVFLSWILIRTGVRVEDLYYAMSRSTWINLLSHGCSILAAVLAGDIVARIEKVRPYMRAGTCGVLMTVFVVLQFCEETSGNVGVRP